METLERVATSSVPLFHGSKWLTTSISLESSASRMRSKWIIKGSPSSAPTHGDHPRELRVDGGAQLASTHGLPGWGLRLFAIDSHRIGLSLLDLAERSGGKGNLGYVDPLAAPPAPPAAQPSSPPTSYRGALSPTKKERRPRRRLERNGTYRANVIRLLISLGGRPSLNMLSSSTSPSFLVPYRIPYWAFM